MLKLAMHLKTKEKKARVEEIIEETVPLELEKETTLPQKIESILLDNLEAIKTYDANKDGVIDETELQTAPKASQDWTNLSLYAEENWFYFGSGKPIGSMSWEKLRLLDRSTPKCLYLSKKMGIQKILNFGYQSELWMKLKSWMHKFELFFWK
jgi:hypothetical protein